MFLIVKKRGAQKLLSGGLVFIPLAFDLLCKIVGPTYYLMGMACNVVDTLVRATKIFLNSSDDNIVAERLAGEHIQIHCIVLVYEMSSNIRGLNQLDHTKPSLVRIMCSEMLDNWLAKCDHIDALD